tara:strand:- start:7068 stop:7871 length:804 start_codon:yes stop_codon:yes gene_type:complete
MGNETKQSNPDEGNLDSKKNSIDIKLPFWLKHFRLLSFGILAVLGFLFFRNLLAIESQITDAAAITIARNYIQTFESFRTLYTSKVVETAREQGIEVTHDYHQKKGAIPLPATLSRELGEHIARETKNGLDLRLYSIYPFPWRIKDYKPLDNFEKDAFVAIKKNKQNPFYRIEDQNGKRVARYAKADLMREACVSCHNSHPQTPKSDWKVGDLRGVLEVSFPLTGFENKEVHALHVTQYTLIFFFVFLAGGFLAVSYVIENYIKSKL